MTSAEQLAKNAAANEVFVKLHYPNEIFISNAAQHQSKNKFLRGIIIPKGVMIAESRIPRSYDQREILRKELRQAGMLANIGYSVFLIPENTGYKIRPKDAVINGQLFEFRNITGNEKTLEWQFRDAKKKGIDTNVFINVDSNINRHEAQRRVGNVLRRHLEYTGSIIMSFNNGENVYFLDTDILR